MERKIGEIFEYNGEWYQCVKGLGCNECDLSKLTCYHCFTSGSCSPNKREDETQVIFKKLEKVGEPYMLEDKKFQKYMVFKTPYIYNKVDCSWQSFSDPYYVSLEIKQDMEEKKLDLKPFDIQKARAGKPVCTRDGRKARIICFDKGGEQPIVALIEKNEEESIDIFFSNGHSISKTNKVPGDLMMLPKKHEGWVNIYYERDARTHREAGWVYGTEEEAVRLGKERGSEYVTTAKIEWYE